MSTLVRAPGPGRIRLRRLGGPLGTAAVVGLGALALRLRDPHQQGAWGLCPLKEITGWNCPFCGGLRAVNDLGHGQVADAAQSNLLFVASIPLLIAVWALWMRVGWTGRGVRISPAAARRIAVVLAVLAVVFTLYRNTPWGTVWYAA